MLRINQSLIEFTTSRKIYFYQTGKKGSASLFALPYNPLTKEHSGEAARLLSPRQSNNMKYCVYTFLSQFQFIDQDLDINCQVDERDFAEKNGRIYSLDRKPLPIDFWDEKKESEEAAESEK